ncbi:CAP domain-containing protein [Sinorhizobium sp. BG8]|uniref:CAP domain-containing protein n=1 Tax=Sinorhizobium sp. BG8 TaxID=2613773 RepID=UPI00193D5146|nr:CAP domain-containing protein [Sinorhizobium sp. BG8]QRM56808.1 CAP domain-containing protein [Sinorhizobium sp. BG8]
MGRRAVLLAGATGLAALATGCSTVEDLKPSSGNGSDETDATLGMINKLRTDRGLPQLARDPAAANAAMDQAARMAKAGKMEHNIGLGANFLKRMKGMEVALPAAENIAEGQETAERAFDAWYNSPKHLTNMLGSSYRGLGVAMVTNPASGNRPYWSMVLSS